MKTINIFQLMFAAAFMAAITQCHQNAGMVEFTEGKNEMSDLQRMFS